MPIRKFDRLNLLFAILCFERKLVKKWAKRPCIVVMAAHGMRRRRVGGDTRVAARIEPADTVT